MTPVVCEGKYDYIDLMADVLTLDLLQRSTDAFQ